MRKERTTVIATRVPASTATLVREHAAALGERPADTLRRAISEALAQRKIPNKEAGCRNEPFDER